MPHPPLKQSWLSSERPVPRLIARPLRRFIHTEAGGGLLLLAAAITALAWANSPFGATYETFWHTEIALRVGDLELTNDLRHWINDGLMTLFFFVVGLEIKRELVVGELNEVRKAMLPAIAAIGGMVGPAVVYLAFNTGGPGIDGWGIPMATDIAFAVGVLALLGDRVPTSLKIFVLTLAIVDDIGAIAVIALFYSAGTSMQWLLAAAALLIGVVILRRLRVLWMPVYVVIGVGIWLATLLSGVHATIAGVALGLMTPARPTDPSGFDDVMSEASRLPSDPDAEYVHGVTAQAKEVVPVTERLEHLLHPWTSYVVIPLFALANAGLVLRLGDAISTNVVLGVATGLVVGKTVGISVATWLAVKLGIGRLPEDLAWSHVIGAATIAGIGFTVSLFITTLAFSDVALVDSAKIGVLVGSTLAGAMGAALLARSRPTR